MTPSDKDEAERRYPMAPQCYAHNSLTPSYTLRQYIHKLRAAYIAGREDERAARERVIEALENLMPATQDMASTAVCDTIQLCIDTYRALATAAGPTEETRT